MKALELFQQLGFDLFIVTNQSGVGRGYFSLENVYQIHRQIQNDMRAHKLKPFVDFAICPHSPSDHCDCRKPSGKMIRDFIEKYHISPTHSYMLGDKQIDADAGADAGITGVIVRGTHPGLLEFAKSLKQD